MNDLASRAFYAAYCKNGSSDALNVQGNQSQPVNFEVTKHTVADFYVTRLIFRIRDAQVEEYKFGGLNQLQNGIQVKIQSGGEPIQEWFVAKTNAELVTLATAGEIEDNAYRLGDSNYEGLIVARFEFGFPLCLRANSSDTIQVVVQDDLRSLTLFNVWTEGWLQ